MSTLQDYGQDATLRASRYTRLYRGTFALLAAGTDIAVIMVTSVATGLGYHFAAYGNLGNTPDFVEIGAVAAWLFSILNVWNDEYTADKYYSIERHPRRIFHFWTIAFSFLITVAFLTKISDAYSRGWMALFYVTGFCTLALARTLPVRVISKAIAAGLVASRRALLVGAQDDILDFMRHYQPSRHGLQIIDALVVPTVGGEPNQAADGIYSQLRAAVARARVLDPDEIFIIVPWSRADIIEQCIDAFVTVPATLHLAPERILDRFADVQIEKFGPISSLRLSRRPLSALEAFEKRLMDLVVASATLTLLLPLFAVLAVLIKLDSPGPVFFLQRRYGFNQRPFRIIKFRTMTTLDDGAVIVQATRDDGRVTRIGRWLRRWNIDELPQLVNVLRGDMSLVGPRPHALAHDQAWEGKIALYARRHNVKPGITGWAQVHGLRGEIGSDERLRKRIEYDLFYIDNWSIWLDLQILFLTVVSRKSYENAH